MAYDPNTGERVKNPYAKITWIHQINKQWDFVLQQCLFGLHLIKENKSKTVAIVESEKTAIIMYSYARIYLDGHRIQNWP